MHRIMKKTLSFPFEQDGEQGESAFHIVLTLCMNLGNSPIGREARHEQDSSLEPQPAT
jgi:hypothetical protein